MQAEREPFLGRHRPRRTDQPTHMFGIADGSMAGMQLPEKLWRKRL
ncbi:MULTISPECIES: hypothetical protein [unclassified Mesorhizobium]